MDYSVEEPTKTYRIRNAYGTVVAESTDSDAAYQLALWLQKGVLTLGETQPTTTPTTTPTATTTDTPTPTASSWMPGTRKLTDEQIEQMRACYRAGMTYTQLATQFNVSTGTVYTYCRGVLTGTAADTTSDTTSDSTNGSYVTAK